MHQCPRSDTARKDDQVGRGALFERCISNDPQESVLAADLATLVTDERHLDLGDALQHLVRADPVERGEPGEEGDDGVDGHGVLLNRWRYWSGETPRRLVKVRRIVSAVP